ncbi:hypothetical protein D3C71_1964930 [compost metagenome]
MAGNAVLTIVVSSVCMKKQAATTQSRACRDEGLAMGKSYCANADGRLTDGLSSRCRTGYRAGFRIGCRTVWRSRCGLLYVY